MTHLPGEEINDDGMRCSRLVKQMWAEHDVGGIVLVIDRPWHRVAEGVLRLGRVRQACH